MSQLVMASEGGTVPVAGGSIAIPAGALASDTTITATVSDPSSSTPSSDKVAGKVLELGPDGTTFTMPVTLTLPLTKTPAANQSASLAYLDKTSNAWVTTPSTVAGGKVSGGIMHFSTWTIIITVNGGAAPDCSFTKCGGTLDGTYKVTGACIGGITDSFTQACAAITASADVSVTGGITLNTDGTYMSDFNATMAKINVTYPASCLPAGATCDDLSSSFGQNNDPGTTASCTAASGGGCTCTITEVNNNPDPPESGTWSSMPDGTYTSMKTGDTTPGDFNAYCVSGSTLKVASTDSDGKTSVIILQKQ
ncbi:MAG TPA: hypothetical protein VHJ20_01740 [Polyangia bacterium]|nr:hypothetical protein [Polyangia bacterium]